MADIDKLNIQIKVSAQEATKALDSLVLRISRLSASLNKLPTNRIEALAKSIKNLSAAVTTIKAIDARTFTALANNINKLASINYSRLLYASISIGAISRSLRSLAKVPVRAKNIADLINSLSKLGSASVTRAITNLPILTRELNNLINTLSRAPKISKNILNLITALSRFSTTSRSVVSYSSSLSRAFSLSGTSMGYAETRAFSLARAFGTLYANFFLLIRAVKAFGRAITSTSDYIEAYNYYNVAFGKIADEWKNQYSEYGYENAEAYSNSFTERMNESLNKMSGLKVSVGADGTGLLTTTGMKNLGLNIQEVTQYASQLASVTNSVGQTGEVSLIAAEAFTKLGADISSLFNIDYESVMGNLQSGLIGQSRALYKYGIDITNATLQTYAYELGLSKAVSEMTQAEKMQLRMIAILDQSKVSWGDLANTINSPSNMLRQFKNNLSEAGMALGQLFIPIMQKSMPVINGLTIALKNFFVNLASFLGIKIDFSSFGQGYSDLEDDTSDLAENFEEISESVNKASKNLAKFDELNNINTSANSGSLSVELGSSIDLTKEISAAAEEYQKVWDEAYTKMESKAQEFAESIRNTFAPITDPLTRMFQHLSLNGYTQAGEYAGEFIVAIFDTLSSGLEGKGEEVGRAIGLFLKGIDWGEVFASVGNFFATLFDEAAKAWLESFETEPVETIFATAFALLAFTKAGRIIGKKLFTAILLGVAVAFFGFNLGLFLNELLTGEEIDMSWDEILGEVFTSFTDGSWKEALELWGKDIAEAFETAKEELKKWYEEDLSPILNSAGDTVIEFGKTYITEPFKLWANDIKDWWNNDVKPWFTLDKWTGLLDEPLGAFKAFAEDVVGWIDDVKKAWDDFWGNDTTGATSSLSKVSITSVGSGLIGIRPFATGGFPEDGLFYANHTELVGRFSNGRTAVANNAQIVDGIEGGVERAVTNVLAPYLAQIAQNTRETADKEFGITEKQIFDANRHQAQNYTRRTGRPLY